MAKTWFPMSRLWRALIAAAAAFATLCLTVWLYAPVAQGSPIPIYPNVLMGAPDQALLQSSGFTAAYGWTMCALNQPCATPKVAHIANYFLLRSALRGGERGVFMFDLEGGGGTTPLYQGATEADRRKYDLQALGLAAHYHVHLIMASVFSRTDAVSEAVLEARHGAWAIDIQDQFAARQPALYLSIAKSYLAALKAAHVNPVVFDNLSSDPGGYPVTSAELTSSYDRVRSLVRAFWVETPVWKVLDNGTPGPGCAPQGCPLVATGFLTAIEGT